MQRARVPALDLLRSVAFLIVVLFHFASRFANWFPMGSGARSFLKTLILYGSPGTDCFFLVSGYLLCRTLAGGEDWKSAVMRRLGRIYPGFVLVLGIYVVLSGLVPEASRIPGEPFDAALYLIANLLLLPGILPIAPLVTVAWSLSYVGLSYGIFSLLFGPFRLVRWSRGQRSGVWAGAALLIAAAAMWGGFPHGRLVYFALGALLAEWLPDLQAPVRRSLPMLGITGLFLIVAQADFALRAVGLAAFVAAAMQSSVLNRVAARAGAIRVARLSYPVFLTHGFALHLLAWAQPQTSTALDLAGLLLCALALVAATGLLFEATQYKIAHVLATLVGGSARPARA